jgi:hypothetical protein
MSLLPHVQQVTSTSYQSEGVLSYEKLWHLFYKYLCVPPGTTRKSTARKCTILLIIKIHGFRDPTGIVKYGHVS